MTEWLSFSSCPYLLTLWHPTSVLWPGKSHGWRSLVGCSPWGCWVRHDWATLLSLSLSCIGEGNGNPLQCSCLENPRDGGAWWAAIYGVAQSQTRLKWLSSSSSSSVSLFCFTLFGTPGAFWTQMSVFFTKLEKFSANISSNMFSVTFLSLSCFWDPIMQMLSHRFFKRSSFLLFLFSFSYSDWMIFTLILSSASSNLL